ncbi:MAG TPA: GntR family transcriptional regulator [Gemmatimonadaceae bacterium]|nr:GntR family transcriptional regulator [Gemmatimonadaceae bacterium]
MPSPAPPRAPRTRARSASRRPRRERAASGLFGGNGGDDDLVCATIHEAVLDHRLPPGTKLKEIALAELFGVTRSVIRRSLARLAHLRLVELRPNRGAVVASPTAAEARDLFAARRAIEAAVVASLAAHVTREQLRELRAMTRAEREVYAAGDARRGLKLSVEFHRVLARMAGNAVLAEFLDQLVARTPLVVLAHQGPAIGNACSIDEHSQVVDALADGDGPRAVATMAAHLDALLARLDLERTARRETDLGVLLGVRRA